MVLFQVLIDMHQQAPLGYHPMVNQQGSPQQQVLVQTQMTQQQINGLQHVNWASKIADVMQN